MMLITFFAFFSKKLAKSKNLPYLCTRNRKGCERSLKYKLKIF